MADSQPINKDKKDYFNRRLVRLDQEYQTFNDHYKLLSEQVAPRRGRFFVTDRNKGSRRHTNIINSRGSQALRSATSGMFAGIMSPGRPWFKLETLDPDMMDNDEIKAWLYKVETLMRMIFMESNLYGMAPVTLGEAIQFGTGAMSQVDDFDQVARFYSHTIGSYRIGQNSKFEIDTFTQTKEFTVRQIVETWGLDKASMHVKTAWDRGDYDAWYPVVHFIEPNPHYKEGSNESKQLRYRSVWYEQQDGRSYDDQWLLKSGFHEFPVSVPRWATSGEDIYGTDCPGMQALGDVMSLHIMEKRKAQSVEKVLNPPLKGPPSLRDIPVVGLPGGLTIYDGDAQKEGLSPIYQIQPAIQEINDSIAATERRVNEAYFVDLFLAITNMEGIQPKNQLELNQRNEERLLMLGPPLERLQSDFLGQIVERTFNQMVRAEMLPPPPAELSATTLNIRFISALAQAQRAVEVGTIERTSLFASQLSQFNPEVLDVFDFDEALKKFAQLTGTIPSVIVPSDDVDQVRQARAEQQQAQQQAEQQAIQAQALNQGAGGVKQLTEASNAI